MPIEIRDIAGGAGVVITATGILTGDEYRNAMVEHLTQNPEKFRRYRYSIGDYTAAERVDIKTQDIGQVAELGLQAAQINPHPLVAIVASRDLAFGLSRMWELLTEDSPWETQVFRSRAAAEEWLRTRAREKFDLEIPGFD